MNKEIEKMFRRIELDKANDSCGFEFADGFGCTFDNIATCYDDRLELYDLVKSLQSQLEQKEDNWNKLKEWLEDEIADGRSKESLWLMGCYDEIKIVLDKMQEIEGGMNE